MDVKIDITSTLGEKIGDKFMGFVSALIKPSLEESGLLLKDKVTLYRFEKQVKILEKARLICEKHNISTKIISLKLLCPLLDFAGLEDDEELEQSWSNLLSNMVDSEQNIDNHVFPYILSQISIQEFTQIKTIYLEKIARQVLLKIKLEKIVATIKNEEKGVIEEIEFLKDILDKTDSKKNYKLWSETISKHHELQKPTRGLHDKEYDLKKQFYASEQLSSYELEEYENFNLIRLGLIKNVQLPSVSFEESKIDLSRNQEYIYLDELNLLVNTDESELHLTELGEKFIFACLEKNSLDVPSLKSIY